LHGVDEYPISLVNVLESPLHRRIAVVDVGVIAPGLTPKSSLDGAIVCVPIEAKDVVIILGSE